MKRLLLLVLLVGCGKPDPYTGALTGLRVMGVKGDVHPLDDWERGYAKLQGDLGPPTRIKGKDHAWAVVEGETCYYFTVEKEERSKFKAGQSGNIVGVVTSPMKVDKAAGPVMNWQDCVDITTGK